MSRTGDRSSSRFQAKPARTIRDERGRELSWRRVSANAEGQADLAPLVAGDQQKRGLRVGAGRFARGAKGAARF